MKNLRPAFIFAGAALATLCSCADLGKFVWVTEYRAPTTSADAQGVIAEGDLIQIRVFGQDSLATRARVRSDGHISMPLLNEVVAAGFTPAVLAQQLETRLKEFYKLPVVTISLEETKPLSIPVAGEVVRPGVMAPR